MIIYEGFFIISKIASSLSTDIEHKHVTTEFRPEITHEELYGSNVILHVSKYGNDGENEGLYVDSIETDNNTLNNLFNSITVPHITLSVSDTGKPVNTSRIKFDKDWNGATVLDAIFGGFRDNGVVSQNKKP